MQLPAGIVSLDDDQRARLGQYADELAAMNQRINLVSREDAGAIASRHIPHCLTLAIRLFPDGATVVDWGTGGGLPLIPLAIAFPRVRFIGVDAVGKKIQAVRTFARRLGLANVEAWHGRAEEFDEEIDFSVSRATAPLAVLWSWHEPLARHGREVARGDWPPGLVCLKGSDLGDEYAQLPGGVSVERMSIAPLLSDDYFATKEIVCVARSGFDG